MLDTGRRTIHKETHKVCAEPHCNICKEMGVKSDNEQWCDPVQYGQVMTVTEQVQTDRTFPNIKPGIIIRDKKRKQMLQRQETEVWSR